MEKIICAVVDGLGDHDHTIISLDGCTQASSWLKNTKAEVVKFDRPRSRWSYLISQMRLLRRCNPDLLMTYNWGSTDAIWLGRLAGIRNIIHHEHGFSIEESWRTLWKRDCMRFLVYRLCSKIVVVSHELESLLKRHFRVNSDKIQRIPNGVDVLGFSPDETERQRVRKESGFGDGDCVLGFSGRLDPVKNLDLLVDIFRCADPCKNPFRLLLVGDGPDRARLETRCQENGLSPYVRFVGQQASVLPYLRAMDVFLLTSLREQMPLTVLEAMAVGMPVVSTRVGDLPHMIDDGVDGFLRDLGAPAEKYLDSLSRLLYGARRSQMGQAARNKIIEEFEVGKMIKQYCDLIT